MTGSNILLSPPVRWLARAGLAATGLRHYPVFTVHRVATGHSASPAEAFLDRWTDLDLDTLEHRAGELDRRFRLVTCGELAAALSEPPEDGKPLAALTFDDGYAEFATHVAPLLKRLGIPATLFVVTSHLERGELIWPLKLHYLATLIQAKNGGIWPANVIGELLDRPGAGATPQSFADHLEKEVTTVPPAQIGQLISRWSDRLGIEPAQVNEPGLLLRWDALQKLSDDGFEIGSHSVNHPWMGAVDPEARMAELVSSREILESRLGRKVTGFCIPRGTAPDVQACPPELLHKAGYLYACTCVHGLNGAGRNPLALRRTPLKNESDNMFGARLEGLIELAASLSQGTGF